jgi:hypothetical protein
MRFARVSRIAAVASLALAGFVTLAPSVMAAPYPPQPGAPGTGALGVAIGGTTSPTLCGFAPGSTVTVMIDGQPVGSLTAGSDACVTFPVSVLSSSKSQVLGLTIATTCGANSVSGSGTGANGTATTASTSFSVICATASTGIVFTGSNSVRDLEFGGGLFVIGGLLVFAFRRRERQAA